MKRLLISILVAICLIASMTVFAGDKTTDKKLVGGQFVFAPASHSQFTTQSGRTYTITSRVLILNASVCRMKLELVRLEGSLGPGPQQGARYDLVGGETYHPAIVLRPGQSVAYRVTGRGIPFFPQSIDLDGDGLTEGVRPHWLVKWSVISKKEVDACSKISPPLIESNRTWIDVFPDGGGAQLIVSVDYEQGRVVAEW